MRPLVLTFLLLNSSASVLAASIDQVYVTKDQQSFVAVADFTIDLPRGEVVKAFGAVDRFAELNPAVQSSSAEIQADGVIRVSSVINDCVVLFCRSFAMVEDFRFDGQYGMQTTIVPELSDFSYGTATWHFTDLGQQTRVSYRSQVTPDFWLPPLLGVRAIRKSLIRQIRATSDILESLHGRE